MIPRRKLLDRTVQDRDARLYFVIVEGAKTETLYFHALEEQNLVPRSRVKLHIFSPDGNASAPTYLIGKAGEVAKNRVIGADDEIWLVFDVDRQSGSDRIKQVNHAVTDATQLGWYVAVSNPCFELWLLLHVSDDLTGINDRGDSIEPKLKAVLGGYNKRRIPAACLSAEAIARATARARQGDTDPVSPFPAMPGTRVYRLIESILRTQPRTE